MVQGYGLVRHQQGTYVAVKREPTHLGRALFFYTVRNVQMSWLFFLPLLALGLGSGLLAGLLGVGGGMVLVPFLTYLLVSQGVPQEHIVHVAVGTSLGVIAFTSLSSLRAHHKAKALIWPIVVKITPGILIGSLIGSKIADLMPTRELALFFGVFVTFSATQMLIDKKPKPSRELPGAAGLAGVGTVIGCISSLVGAGGGFLSVPLMTWCNVHMRNAVATSAAIGFPIAIFSSTGYVINGWNATNMPPGSLGYLYLPALFGIVATSVFTAPIGAKLAHKLPVKTLKRVFACVLYFLAVSMVYKGLNS